MVDEVGELWDRLAAQLQNPLRQPVRPRERLRALPRGERINLNSRFVASAGRATTAG
jgi:hypothetical protein